MAEAKAPQLEPAIFAIFGLTGDLAQRKLLPALYNLLAQNLLHEHTVIIGISRRPVDVDEVINSLVKDDSSNGGSYDDKVVDKLRGMIRMYQMDLTNGDDYDKLHTYLNDIESEHGVCMNRLYYLSIPPQMFGPIVRLLGTHKLR